MYSTLIIQRKLLERQQQLDTLVSILHRISEEDHKDRFSSTFESLHEMQLTSSTFTTESLSECGVPIHKQSPPSLEGARGHGQGHPKSYCSGMSKCCGVQVRLYINAVYNVQRLQRSQVISSALHYLAHILYLAQTSFVKFSLSYWCPHSKIKSGWDKVFTHAAVFFFVIAMFCNRHCKYSLI